MTTYTITLTQADDDALAYATVSQQEWIENLVRERCRIATDEIVQITVQKCLDNNIQIPGTRGEIVELAYAQGWVKTGAQRNAEAEAQAAQRG